jgi:outer membrane protein OmpA-like peptidoglycan-associated protein
MFDLNMAYGSFKPTMHGKRFKKDANSPYRTFLFPINLAIRVASVEEGKFKPYGTASIGALIWDLRNVGGTNTSFWGDQKLVWGQKVQDKTQVETVVMGGLGVEIYLTESFTLDLQGGFNGILGSHHRDNVGVGDENDAFFEGRATLSYYFGYSKDTDKDGIKDKIDADPLNPEDFDGFQDEDGAPEYDNDNDGIPDLRDVEPNKPEDLDGFQDEDGAPDLDNDNDGILDENDLDPNQAEDMDGFEDDDGKPDLDNDNDGILDVNDNCPNEAETFNGYEDSDGCPDKAPLPKLEKKGAKLILEGVNFKSGSATLEDESFETLDKVVAGLKDNPDVNLEIRGYTDDRGSAKVNQRLSEKRANSVMQYLINAGIDQTRLRAVGYGESDPIATNKTAEGRAQNRRIEFVRID